jgi:hypothetical protein
VVDLLQKYKISAERGTLSAEILDFCRSLYFLQKFTGGVDPLQISAEI